MIFILLINVKRPTIVGILTFMNRINFMLTRVEPEKGFSTSGPGPGYLSFNLPMLHVHKKLGYIVAGYKGPYHMTSRLGVK